MRKPRRIAQKMRIKNADGDPLYLNAFERVAFLLAAKEENPARRIFCNVLHDTGCRLSEGLELNASRICLDTNVITIRSLKKRVNDHYRDVPVSEKLTDLLDITFDLKKRQSKRKLAKEPLFDMTKPTAYRMIKRVMARAGIEGAQAMPKGLRHGYAIALFSGEKPAPLNIVSELLGHTDIETTQIYLKAVGAEKRKLVLQALGQA